MALRDLERRLGVLLGAVDNPSSDAGFSRLREEFANFAHAKGWGGYPLGGDGLAMDRDITTFIDRMTWRPKPVQRERLVGMVWKGAGFALDSVTERVSVDGFTTSLQVLYLNTSGEVVKTVVDLEAALKRGKFF
jgi:hypothetical protein